MQVAAANTPTVVSQTLASAMSQLGRAKSAASQSSSSSFAGSVASSAPMASSASSILLGSAKPSLSDQVLGFMMQNQQEMGEPSAKAPSFTTTTPVSDGPSVSD
ncbi:MAG: hypothetical protein ABSA49_09930 [Rhizomicrobium sp.]|jgi:hypothetical protein